MSKTTVPVRMDAEEWYPVYTVVEDRFGLVVEATAEQVARWSAAREAFETAQDEMGVLYEAAHEETRARARREQDEREAAEKARLDARSREVEQERAAEAARRDAMWQQIAESGGVVYDAQGHRVGTIEGGDGGRGYVRP